MMIFSILLFCKLFAYVKRRYFLMWGLKFSTTVEFTQVLLVDIIVIIYSTYSGIRFDFVF